MKIYKKWWFWVIIVVIVIGLIGSAGSDGAEKSKDNETKTKQEEKVIFLKGTNSEEFVSILESVTGIENTKGVVMGDSINYENSNNKYMISVDANKETKEIDYVQIICLTSEDPVNVFMSLHRMNYVDENDAEFTEWLNNNIGKESTKKIGSANYELGVGTNKYPFLTMKSDGSDDYNQEQIDKALNK